MTCIITAFASLSLFCLGYIGVCDQLRTGTLSEKLRTVSKGRALYIGFAVAASVLLIVLFHRLYDLPLLTQLKLLTLVFTLLPAAAVDYRCKRIPNLFLSVSLGIRLVFYGAEFLTDAPAALGTLKSDAVGALLLGGFFLLLLLVFKGSIGMGDIKLFALMGLYQGLWGAINSVFFSLTVSFFAAVALLISKKKGRKDTIPFGPCALLGTVAAMALSGM